MKARSRHRRPPRIEFANVKHGLAMIGLGVIIAFAAFFGMFDH
jgi:hypothetical protein